MLLRSRIVIPVTAPPIEDGAVLVSEGRITAVGRWSEVKRLAATRDVIDLGEAVLLPGLINAHCHLDYTGFSGYLPPPRSFTDWIQGVLALKAEWSFSEYATSWLNGARQLLESGCTTVVDIEAVPELLPEAWMSTPLRVVSALEMTGVRAGKPPETILREALARLECPPHPRCSMALAPHAPYSTLPDLLRLTADYAREHQTLITLHLAESLDEFEMFRHARGLMYQWLRNQRPVEDCGTLSPVGYVATTGLLETRSLLAHVNYLDTGDMDLLARSNASVVHCPRSHAYFGHAPFRFAEMLARGVNVCLGTDSLLSVRKRGRVRPRLDLMSELAAAAASFSDVPAERLLESVTVCGARALGRSGESGELCRGACADLVAFTYGGAFKDVIQVIVQNQAPISATMIEGRWIKPPSSSGNTG